ncbi:unnamed protein product [Rhizophagus irregularis]|nr:unnamed protein product [Rhizophagus irregularis]CAB5362725.1 unnamed protein product [Rhizophagus irregularis]
MNERAATGYPCGFDGTRVKFRPDCEYRCRPFSLVIKSKLQSSFALTVVVGDPDWSRVFEERFKASFVLLL